MDNAVRQRTNVIKANSIEDDAWKFEMSLFFRKLMSNCEIEGKTYELVFDMESRISSNEMKSFA